MVISARIVRHAGEQQRIDRQRPADRQAERVAVGRGLGDRVGAEIAARARLVLDHEVLAELVLEVIGDQPHHQVGGRAGAERHDQLDRPGRPALRQGGNRRGDESEKRNEKPADHRRVLVMRPAGRARPRRL
jgi:hypothetical protein